MEACYNENSSSPVNMDTSTTYYYGGPGVYCVIIGNAFYNIFDDTYLTIDAYQSLSASEICAYNYEINSASIVSNSNTSTLAYSKSSSTTKIHSVGYNYFSNLTQFGENTNGTCTVIAISILLGYYDNYNNDAIIASRYENGNGTTEEFHQLLNNYVYGSAKQGGIFIHNAAPGINKYFTANNLACTLESEYSSQTAMINSAITQLQSGNPIVASMGTSHSAPYDHTVLVYQVQYDSASPSSTAVFTIHMGWNQDTVGSQSATEYLASAGWFYECGYIQNNCTTHSLSSWKDYDSFYHCKYCVNCTYIELESHSPYWDSILGKCSRCKRTGTIGNVFG